MKLLICIVLGGILLFSEPAHAAGLAERLPLEKAREFIGERQAVLVVIDSETGDSLETNPELASQRFGPCSTYKIWNTLIGLEEGILSDPEAPFYRWDGQQRKFPGWNQDLTLREAFQASCVPAFQELARKIGPQRTQYWLDQIGYGNRDLCNRPDAFWLPRPGEKNILITPREQAELVQKLISGTFPFSKRFVDVVRDLMKSQTTQLGTLHGKTGSGTRHFQGDSPESSDFDMGWFVGFLEQGGKKYAFACLVLGPGISGKEARAMVESLFKQNHML